MARHASERRAESTPTYSLTSHSNWVPGQAIVIVGETREGKTGRFVKRTEARVCVTIDGMDDRRFLLPSNAAPLQGNQPHHDAVVYQERRVTSRAASASVTNDALVPGCSVNIVGGTHKGKQATFLRRTDARVVVDLHDGGPDRFLKPDNVRPVSAWGVARTTDPPLIASTSPGSRRWPQESRATPTRRDTSSRDHRQEQPQLAHSSPRELQRAAALQSPFSGRSSGQAYSTSALEQVGRRTTAPPRTVAHRASPSRAVARSLGGIGDAQPNGSHATSRSIDRVPNATNHSNRLSEDNHYIQSPRSNHRTNRPILLDPPTNLAYFAPSGPRFRPDPTPPRPRNQWGIDVSSDAVASAIAQAIDATIMNGGGHYAPTNESGVERQRYLESVIQRLPTSSIERPERLPTANAVRECVVCLQEYAVGDVRKILPCFHGFHQACVDPWLRRHGACPLCRRDICLNTLG